MQDKSSNLKEEYFVKTQRFDLVLYVLLFCLAVGCFMMGPLGIGVYNKDSDLHYLYIGKIGFWLFPVGLWFFCNLLIRFAYSSLINGAYNLEKKDVVLNSKDQADFDYAIKKCLQIKRFSFLFFFFPNRFDPYNKEIDRYFSPIKAKKVGRGIGSYILFFLIILGNLGYIATGIFSWTQLISDWNYQTSYPVVAQRILKIYEDNITERLKNPLIQKTISQTDFTEWISYKLWNQGNRSLDLASLILQRDGPKGLTYLSILIYGIYWTDLWNKGIDFYTLLYVTDFNKLAGELTFYIKVRLVDSRNYKSQNSPKDNDPSIFYSLNSKEILLAGFVKVNEQKS